MLCGEAKGLEAFGKAQRKNPDTAVTTILPAISRLETNILHSVARFVSMSKAKKNGRTSNGTKITMKMKTATKVEAGSTPTPMNTNM